MPVYIKASALVSAQNTFALNTLDKVECNSKDLCFKIITPNYKEYIQAGLLRRMSRLIKFSLASAFQCLSKHHDTKIDAVITATGLGCLDDTGVFMQQMHKNKEKLLAPTAFIRSTHNAVGGQIALLKKLHVQNLSYTQKSFSFESALFDAMLLLDENESENILIGGFDENTEFTINIRKQMNCLNDSPIDKKAFITATNKGIHIGEGAGFFLLSNKKDASVTSKIIDLHIQRKLKHSLEIYIEEFLIKNNSNIRDIDLVLLGVDGSNNTKLQAYLVHSLFKNTNVAAFKNVSGCFDTDTCIALWLANLAISTGNITEDVMLHKKIGNDNVSSYSNILIVNGVDSSAYSFILIGKC